jgi:hypothetical protein
METKKTYIAPQLTVVSFKAEQGYSLSAASSMRLFQDASLDAINDDYNSSNQENWYQDSKNIFGNEW